MKNLKDLKYTVKFNIYNLEKENKDKDENENIKVNDIISWYNKMYKNNKKKIEKSKFYDIDLKYVKSDNCFRLTFKTGYIPKDIRTMTNTEIKKLRNFDIVYNSSLLVDPDLEGKYKINNTFQVIPTNLKYKNSVII